VVHSAKESKTRDAEATQVSILDAAEEEFARHGLKAARTETIAARTGVTKAMIYYYFQSKEKLYQAVLDRAFSEYVHLPKQLDLDQLPSDEALEQVVRGLLASVSCNQNIPQIMFHEAIQNHGEYYKQAGFLTVLSTMSAILERGMSEGDFRPLDAPHTAVNILGTCVFYCLGYENLKHFWPDKQMHSQKMLEQHTQEAIALVMAGVQRHENGEMSK
jgi:AcrR family transcriptional regulator